VPLSSCYRTRFASVGNDETVGPGKTLNLTMGFYDIDNLKRFYIGFLMNRIPLLTFGCMNLGILGPV
jgi:hypothetical protein